MKRIADLFSGAGGAANGLHDAGFEVVGFDIKPQPRYPYEFHQRDVMTMEPEELSGFDAVWASPPCQRYSVMSRQSNDHPDLYVPTRTKLEASDKPFIIENVIGAPYNSGIVLCGSMFGLPVRRHRNFETSWLILNSLRCRHQEQGRPITVTGDSGSMPTAHSWKGVKAEWPQYMGMPWATPVECTQAVPPAYSEFLGKQLLRVLGADATP